MPLKYVRRLAFLLFLVWQPMGLCLTLNHLYEVDLPLAEDQSPEDMPALIQQGLETVVIRLVGSDKQGAALRVLRAASDNYLKTYQTEPQKVRLIYNGSAIESALQRANMVYWGQNRPLTLLWLGAETMQEDFLKDWQKQASNWGISLVLPITELNTLESPDLQAMKKQYAADVLWQGQLAQRGRGFIIEWELSFLSEHMRWEVKASTLDALWQSSLQTLDEQLRKQYLSQQSGWYNKEGMLNLEIVNVRSAKSAADLLNYLKGINGVKRVQVQSLLPPDTMQVQLWVSGSDARLDQAFTLDQQLVPIGNQQYRWTALDEK